MIGVIQDWMHQQGLTSEEEGFPQMPLLFETAA
jgi:hypothetical protein